MNPGRLNKRVTLLQQTATQNSLGESVESFSNLANRWAAIEPLNGREYFQTSGENSEVTTRIRLRYDSKTQLLTHKDRVLYGSTVYLIESVINPKQGNAELVLMCVDNERNG